MHTLLAECIQLTNPEVFSGCGLQNPTARNVRGSPDICFMHSSEPAKTSRSYHGNMRIHLACMLSSA